MLWQITKYHLFRSSIHSFVLFFFLSFSFFSYVHLQYFVPQWPCFAIMEMAFFAIVWRMYHQQHFMLTCQCVHHCAVLHFIMEMLSKPLAHHSLIHWIKTTTTTTTATTCEHNIHPPAPHHTITCTITMCPFTLFGFTASNHCDFVVHSVFGIILCTECYIYPSCIYSSILFPNPIPPTQSNPHRSPLRCVYFWLCCYCCVIAGGGVYVLWHIKLMLQTRLLLNKWSSFTIEWKCDGKIIYRK